MSSIYVEWGFFDNPFTTRPLSPSIQGRQLLVGRKAELKNLGRRLQTPPKFATVEGPNGIGKTSIINVAAYSALQEYLDGNSNQLLIPCSYSFQIDPEQSTEDFVQRVFLEVAQTLVKHAEQIKQQGFAIENTSKLDKWLNSPHVAAWQGGIPWANLGKAEETNTSDGFAKSGFRQTVRDWLRSIFPDGEGGGVVCLIDNLELLQTSAMARSRLEAIRDSLLTMQGLRWVLCGAAGIVRGIASSPRLEGILHAPIEVSEINPELAHQILESRCDAFANTDEPYMPLETEDFASLYTILRGNIRNVLSKCDDFCIWVSDLDPAPKNKETKNQNFKIWLNWESTQALKSVEKQLRPRAWKTFTDAVERNGFFSPSDYEEFGFKSMMAMRPQVKDLESAGLMTSTQDENDNRRKTIQVTPKGWLVAYAKQLNTT